jgi:hypothetical protein
LFLAYSLGSPQLNGSAFESAHSVESAMDRNGSPHAGGIVQALRERRTAQPGEALAQSGESEKVTRAATRLKYRMR